MTSLTSLLGLATFLFVAWLMSENRRRFPWRIVGWGLALQIGLGWFILKTQPGMALFDSFNRLIVRFIGYANEGSRIVFGPLASQESLANAFGSGNALILAITVSATIILVSSVSALLYHLGLLQLLVRATAWGMRRILGTSGSETLAAVANIFMGHTEAPLLVKPFLPRMTRSELLTLMVGGMATIAGGVLAAYVSFGIPAGHLLTASVMSAPAGLMIAKILIPETEVSETAAGARPDLERTSINSMDALCQGASDGLRLSLNVIAMLIAFAAVIALANGLLAGLQTTFLHAGISVGLVSMDPIDFTPFTLQSILGWINAPVAWLLGVPWQDCQTIGAILGERIVLNEFVGYLSLTSAQESLDPRSYLLTTYALCGFANLGSIAIQIGGVGSLVPERRNDIARLGLRSMLGGLLACYITTCVVGLIS